MCPIRTWRTIFARLDCMTLGKKLRTTGGTGNLAFAALLGLAVAGCDTFRGPGIDYTAPRITGRVIDAEGGAPVRNARVGRQIWRWRGGTGEFLKGAEEMVLSHDFVRTGRDGAFDLPPRQVALLFAWGETPLNTRLTIQHGGFIRWQTNYPLSALSTNTDRLELPAGDVAIRRKP